MMHQMKKSILAIAPACDGTDVGEAWCAFQWVKGLARDNQVTLLTMQKAGRTPAAAQLDNVEVITWNDLPYVHRWERMNSMLKPGYVRFYTSARQWIIQQLKSGRQFDISHQFTPIALRYPSPAAGLGIPLVVGPLAGSLDTPEAFQQECAKAPLFTRLRGVDAFRLRHDRLLRRTYSDAAVVIGVAPYVRDLMDHIPLKRFEIMSELGVDTIPGADAIKSAGSELRLAHVGRAIRTKGLRDVVRAMGQLRHIEGISLESAGDGEDLEACRAEARKLGIEDRITFHGKVSRERVEEIYQNAHAFVFPSFREPSGGVIFESLRHGLPVITTDRGGPANVIDESCGIRVEAENPKGLANNLAQAIVELKSSPSKIQDMSRGAVQKMESIGLWSSKAKWLNGLYEEVLQS